MDGVSGVAGWRWIFIIEGIATVLAATLTAFLLPRGIETAKFLTEEERQFARQYHLTSLLPKNRAELKLPSTSAPSETFRYRKHTNVKESRFPDYFQFKRFQGKGHSSRNSR